MRLRERIAIALAEAKVDHVDDVRLLSQTHREIVGLDIAVDEVLAVDVLDALDELDG